MWNVFGRESSSLGRDGIYRYGTQRRRVNHAEIRLRRVAGSVEYVIANITTCRLVTEDISGLMVVAYLRLVGALRV